MSDWSTIIRKGKDYEIGGEHWLGARNETGSRILEFCSKFSRITINTLFMCDGGTHWQD